MDRSRFPFNACLQDLQIRRLVSTGRWPVRQAGRIPGCRQCRGEGARRPPERAGGGLRPARPRVHRDLRGTDRLLRRAWPRPESAPLRVHRRPRRRNVPVKFIVFARYGQRAGALPVPSAGRQPGGWTLLGGGLTSEPPPATVPRPERRASWCSALPTCPGLRNGIWRPSPPGHAHAVATENGRAGG
jgi:hypothetical protein